MAKKKDKELQDAIAHKHTSDLGLFHGIPISIKDHIDEKGKINTVGCCHYANNVAKEDSLVVKLLKD